MLDRFLAARNAEQLVRAWGPIDFRYPVRRGPNFRPGSRIGVLIDSPTGLRYGHMLFGLSAASGKPVTPFVLDHLCLEKQIFHPHFRAHRCLVPVDCWYFHLQDAKRKKHFLFRSNCKASLAMAALYITHVEKGGVVRSNTCGLLSISASRFYDGYSAQMPALFMAGEKGAKDFLEKRTPWYEALKATTRFPADLLEVIPCAEDDAMDMGVG
jgi:putative SOS response-associated peptidase YedK